MKKPPKSPSPVVSTAVHRRETGAARNARTDRDTERRHALFLQALDRIDRDRGGRPHRPALVEETLRADTLTIRTASVCQNLERLAAQADITAAQITAWDAPVIRAICAQVGPRTGDHPQATRVDRPISEPRPQATRTRPDALQATRVAPAATRAAVATSCAMIVSAVATALFLTR